MEPDQPVYVDQITFSCDGGSGPLGHPRVYLKIAGGDGDGGGEIVCPYCSRRFVLSEGANKPAGH